MLPPGLAFLALSERAWRAVATAKTPRFYFDLKRERDNQRQHTTAWTPAISLVSGTHAALRLIFAEGLEAVFARHARLARATRAAAQALGLRLVAPECPSPATTGIYLPEGVPGKIVGYLRDKVGITFAGGQDQLKGKIVRVAHLGYIGTFDVVTAVAALEMGLAAYGHSVAFGTGVGAAEAVLMDGMPPVGAA
jgi:aspartate aminotransferase-like enzyme